MIPTIWMKKPSRHLFNSNKMLIKGPKKMLKSRLNGILRKLLKTTKCKAICLIMKTLESHKLSVSKNMLMPYIEVSWKMGSVMDLELWFIEKIVSMKVNGK